MAAQADSGVVDVNGGGAGVQASGVVIDPPLAIAVGNWVLHKTQPPDLASELPGKLMDCP